MEEVTRYVSIAYLVLGLALAWVLSRTIGLFLATVSPAADLVLVGEITLSVVLGVALAVGCVWYCLANEKISKYSNEVAIEMMKVSWPTGEETKRSSYTVVVVSVFTAICIFFTDFVWRVFTSAVFSS